MKKVNTENYLGLFIKYVSLSILGTLGISCYLIADTIFIERATGPQGLAALNYAIPMFNVMNAVGLMTAVGWSARFAILKGSGDQKGANKTFTQGFKVAVIAGLIFTILGNVFCNSLATVMGASAGTEIHKLAALYIRVVLSFSPMFMLNSFISCFIRNDGSPQFAMTATIIGCLSNVVLDYIFIFPMKMGMLGASLATGVSPLISLVVCSIYFINKKNTFKFTKEKTKARDGFKNSSLGFSSLLAELSVGIVVFCFNRVIYGIVGDNGVSAYGIIANTSLVCTGIFTGLAQGMQPLTGRFYGIGNHKAVKKVYRMTVVTGIGLAVIIYAACFIFTDGIISMFNSNGNETIRDLAFDGVRLYFLAFLPIGFNVVSSIFYASTDNPLPAFFISLSRSLVIIIPVIFILSNIFGMNGVWFSVFVADAITTLGIIIYQTIKRIKEPKHVF